jgi:MFS family permease
MYSQLTNPNRARGPRGRVVKAPQVGAIATASVIGRLPIGMSGVAFVIFVHSRTGSFGVAGLVTGFYTLSCALAGPLLGRAVDRRGPRPVLAPAAVVCALALLAVVAIGESGAATVPLVLAAAVAGASMPPISGVLRRTWPALVPPEDLITAYLFDSVLIETVFVCGPLLTGILAASVAAAAPLFAASGFVLLGSVWFLLVPVVGGEEPVRDTQRRRAGALASPVIRFITLSGLPIGASFGALDVALPAFGASHGDAALGGLYIASLSVGSMLGALLFSVMGGRLGDMRQASLRLAVAQPLLIAPLLLASASLELVVLALVAGSFAAPMITLRSRAAQLTMPAGTGTETFTWLLLAVMVGTSASAALAGPLVELGWRWGVLLAVVAPLAALPSIFAGRRLLPAAEPELPLGKKESE